MEAPFGAERAAAIGEWQERWRFRLVRGEAAPRARAFGPAAELYDLETARPSAVARPDEWERSPSFPE
eukprot:1066998-Lingulodinium_polyedra.AAC.1